MEGIKRKPFQGVLNIIRFNRHFYILVLVSVLALALISPFLPERMKYLLWLLSLAPGLAVFVSLSVSWYIYDYSDLYSFSWLDKLTILPGSKLVNIHAGFDESSALIAGRYPEASLFVFDFYDPAKHTEVSVKRARKAYPPFPGTQSITTDHVPLAPESVDIVFLILAAHEIRNQEEREFFFLQLKASLKPNGRLVVAEHQRDGINFLAYTIGAFHFLSHPAWIRTFDRAGLHIQAEWKQTPFISGFILNKNGTTS
ncbi:MAG: class I SAM-dependent methyltransferase [Bacteroidia bacterium]